MSKIDDLRSEEAQVLQELERLIGKSIPRVNEIEWHTVGVQVEEDRIVGLGLYECELWENIEQILDLLLQLKSLQALDLGGNQLETLPESFGNLKSLQELYIFNNQLKALPESFGQLKSLQELDLSWNQLTTLPESFGELKSLQFLYLNNNELATLPESFGNLISLQDLHIPHNQLRALPESFGQLESLQVLYLEGNQLRALPESFGQLESLQLLDLKGNQLRALPEPILKLKSLKVLSLGGNQLRALPESFGNLQSLQALVLGDNQLETLPESFGDLKSLLILILWGNQLTTLPESFGQLESLQTLYIYSNKLETLPEPILKLKLLEDLNLENNQLRTIPRAILDLTKLERLDLTGNPLKGRSSRFATVLEGENLRAFLNEIKIMADQIRAILEHEYQNQREYSEPRELIRDLKLDMDEARDYFELLSDAGDYLPNEIPTLKVKGEQAMKDDRLDEMSLFGLVVTLGYDLETAKKVGKYLIDEKYITSFPRFPKKFSKKFPIKIMRKLKILKDRFQFYVRIENKHPSLAINDVKAFLHLPSSLKISKDSQEIAEIGTIKPDKFGTAMFYIECTESCKKGDEIGATIQFSDPGGKIQTETMAPYPIDRCLYTEGKELAPDEIKQLKSQEHGIVEYEVMNPKIAEIQDLFANKIDLLPKSIGKSTILFMGQTKNKEPLLIDTNLTPTKITFDIYAPKEENLMGLAHQIICMGNAIKEMNRKLNLMLRHNVKICPIKFFIRHKKEGHADWFYYHFYCPCCKKIIRTPLVEKITVWDKAKKVGKTIAKMCIITGSIFISGVGIFKNIRELISQVRDLFANHQTDLLESLTTISSSLGDLEEDATNIVEKIKSFIQNAKDKKDEDFLREIREIEEDIENLSSEQLSNLYELFIQLEIQSLTYLSIEKDELEALKEYFQKIQRKMEKEQSSKKVIYWRESDALNADADQEGITYDIKLGDWVCLKCFRESKQSKD